MDPLDIARFWSNVEVAHYTACWPWRKGLNVRGYGELKVQGRCREAHRLAFEITADMPLQDETVIRHSCDNRACCNPMHLMSGTHADNVRDRCVRGRSAKGEANAKAKLTEVAVREIRGKPHYTSGELGALYGVSGATILAIRQGRIWKHVI